MKVSRGGGERGAPKTVWTLSEVEGEAIFGAVNRQDPECKEKEI